MTKVATTLKPTLSLLRTYHYFEYKTTSKHGSNNEHDREYLGGSGSTSCTTVRYAALANSRRLPHSRDPIRTQSHQCCKSPLTLLFPLHVLLLSPLSVNPKRSYVLNINHRTLNTPEPSSSASNTPPKTSKFKPRKQLSKTT
jgi:hypothetical protein